jgi:hypothetical protein
LLKIAAQYVRKEAATIDSLYPNTGALMRARDGQHAYSTPPASNWSKSDQLSLARDGPTPKTPVIFEHVTIQATKTGRRAANRLLLRDVSSVVHDVAEHANDQ